MRDELWCIHNTSYALIPLSRSRQKHDGLFIILVSLAGPADTGQCSHADGTLGADDFHCNCEHILTVLPAHILGDCMYSFHLSDFPAASSAHLLRLIIAEHNHSTNGTVLMVSYCGWATVLLTMCMTVPMTCCSLWVPVDEPLCSSLCVCQLNIKMQWMHVHRYSLPSELMNCWFHSRSLTKRFMYHTVMVSRPHSKTATVPDTATLTWHDVSCQQCH